jgi:hypothetical protein
VIGGVVAFVDHLDASAFAGIGGSQSVAPTAVEAGSPLPAGGSVTSFQGRAGSAVGGTGLVFTLFKNGAATAATCTIPSGDTTCSDAADTVNFAAGDVVAVRIQNNSSSFIRDARWTASLATS